MNLEAKVCEALEPLLTNGMVSVVSSDVGNVFDNAVVEMEGGGFRIRVVREKGQVFADLRSVPGDTWFDSLHVRKLIDGVSPATSEIDLDEFGVWLKSRFAELARRMGVERTQTNASLLAIREGVARARWGAL